jgi:hypothetical protein
MFAPPVAKPKTTSAEPQRSAVAAQRPGRTMPAQAQLLQRTIGNQALTRLLTQRADAASNAPGPIQAKLKVGAVDDPLEHEADRVADQVMRMPAPELSAAAAPPRVSRQGKSAGPQAASSEAPAIVHDVLGSPGQPLDAATRGYFEPRFGRDFSGVRVHADGSGAQSAREVNADAYTVGNNMVFDTGRFAPGNQHGRQLIAHELTHVVQQASGSRVVARQSVEQYETRGVSSDTKGLNQAAQLGYWNLKLQDAGFVPVMGDDNTKVRLLIDGQELNAVFSVIARIRPPRPEITQEIKQLITIPKRGGALGRGSHDVLYEIRFTPGLAPDQKRCIVEITFIGEPLEPAGTPSTSFTPKTTTYSHRGFPQGEYDKYWQTHREVQRRVFDWIENSAGPHFDQVITTTVMQDGRSQSTSFKVSGTKNQSGKVSDLLIILLGTGSRQEAAADYASHDFADQGIEQAQTTQHPERHDRLGTIKGLDKNVPEDERASVKYAIWQYFTKGTRNAEVDAIVPIADRPAGFRLTRKPRRVLYTFRFRPQTNDVDIQRIGEEGVEVTLAPQVGLSRVNGFSDYILADADPEEMQALTKWVKERYKGVTLPAITATTRGADIDRAVTAQILAGYDKPEWYKDRYGIEILNKEQAEKVLNDHQGLRKFDPEELKLLEVVLEKMSNTMLQKLRGVKFARQDVFLDWKAGKLKADPETQGITRQGSERTITIFNQATAHANSLFLGGITGWDRKPAVAATTAQVFAHELGHVVSSGRGVKAAFDELVKSKHINPVTWYAASKPPKEFFPEAFSLYYLDPNWLRWSSPDLYQFFDYLDRHGKPPPLPQRRP